MAARSTQIPHLWATPSRVCSSRCMASVSSSSTSISPSTRRVLVTQRSTSVHKRSYASPAPNRFQYHDNLSTTLVSADQPTSENLGRVLKLAAEHAIAVDSHDSRSSMNSSLALDVALATLASASTRNIGLDNAAALKYLAQVSRRKRHSQS